MYFRDNLGAAPIRQLTVQPQPARFKAIMPREPLPARFTPSPTKTGFKSRDQEMVEPDERPTLPPGFVIGPGGASGPDDGDLPSRMQVQALSQETDPELAGSNRALTAAVGLFVAWMILRKTKGFD